MADAGRVCATCGAEYERGVLFCPKDGTALGSSRVRAAQDPYLGLIIAGQVQIRRWIGTGSMGRVYRAFQRGVERDVAVKLLHRELCTNPTLVARFLREAKVASRLTHPNVVQVLMAGQLPAQSAESGIGGELYIVMEYLDGISLTSALAASGGALTLPRSLRVTLQICDAVGEAHAQGVVHRDLKPENVMLVRRGDDPELVKVLDFGIARLDWADEPVATQAGLIFGTARYISPEGSEGQPVGPPADVYAIATILYQCLAGRTPFESESAMALLMQHAQEPAPHILSLSRASYVPAPVASVIMRNLSKIPTDRCADARALGRALIEAAREGGLSPDELVARSSLLGQRGGAARSFVSVQRTEQHRLSPEVAAQIGAPGADAVFADGSVRTEAPADGTVAAGPVVVSAPTADCTLDDNDTEPQGDSGSALVTPPPSPISLSRTDVPEASLTLPAWGTWGGRRARAARMRTAFVVLVCFFAGAAVVAAAAVRLGYLPVPSAPTTRSSYVVRANEAMRRRQWDAPPGENVKQLTDEGLARYPRAPELIEVRQRAAQELMASALGLKYAGDRAGALRLARLALELSQSNTTAQHLVAELETEPFPSSNSAAASPTPDAVAGNSAVHPAGTTSDDPSNQAHPGTRPSSRTRGGGSVDAAAADPGSSRAPSAPAASPPSVSSHGRWL